MPIHKAYFRTIWRWMLRKPDSKKRPDRFIDLAPTGTADESGIYFDALDYAMSNDAVLNVALTGPYGSGKSSVIKSFLSRYSRPALQLSLASFLPEGDNSGANVSKQEIERSILQQILYGIDADKLPLSRFKRIQTPTRWSIVTPLLITIGIGCTWYVVSKQADILSGAFFEPADFSNWRNWLCFGVAGAFVWKVAHGVYVKSLGLSLKSISLKDLEITPNAANEESILNRHLDEIIYFFQSTKYDLVVIEDLDRFENSDIFVTLREINGLINANAGMGRRIRFLYALRDDIFINTDRTKFFEFIVPVVPVINQSNSIDKVLEQGQRIDLDARLDRQFIREVSRYLTDLRLIRNIFNEYVVYSENIRAADDDLLDPNKLLAVLIYKNVIPKDFAALHQQKGVLSTVLERYDEYVAKIEAKLRAELIAIEINLANGEAQFLRDHSELRKVYATAILQRIPDAHQTLHTTNGQVSIAALADSTELESLISQKSVSVFVSSTYAARSKVELRDLEASVDPTRTFAERKAEIDRKSIKFRQGAEKRSLELKNELASLRTRKFNEVIRESAELIEKVFSQVDDGRDLLKFLILEGYLDDTYYQYISLFHSGRLSPNDNKFLIQIRSYNNPSPDFQIDNGAEVIASMRKEDFGQTYVLNRFIFDHLLSDSMSGSQRIADAVEFIATHFEVCGDFFRSYYAKGADVAKLIRTLATRWPNFVAVALGGADGASHAARILAYAPERLLENASSATTLKSFLSDSTRQVLAERVDFDISRLRSLAVEIGDIGSLVAFPSTLLFVAQEGLYRISIDNIGHILSQVVGWPKMRDLKRRHFSTLREANDAALLKRIHTDFRAYVRDVLLTLQDNTGEDVSAISAVLVHDDVEHDLRAEFLKRQTAIFPSFDNIPAAFHQIVLEGRRIEATWENCLGFIKSDAYEPELLTAYLQDSETAAALSRQQIPGDEASLPLRQFVSGNSALDPHVYQSYVHQLPRPFKEFPEVDRSKIRILIEERKITFAPASFGSLQDADLQILFVAANFPAYEAEQGQYSIDDDFRAKLLRTGITEAQKLRLIGDMDESYVAGTPSAAAEIGPLLDRSPLERSNYGVDFIKAVILNSRSARVQISLFNKLHAALSVPEVREVLQGLPEPFQDIATFGRSPKIEGSDINRQFAEWLKERNIISSFGNTLLGDEIRINTFRKEP